jgi:hypothetical protein
MIVNFRLEGQQFIALNGGTMFKFTEAISFSIATETQEETDYYWNKLTSGGGQESRCAWLKDRFGLSWQVVPTALNRLLADPDKKKAQRVMQAMLQMTKRDCRPPSRRHPAAVDRCRYGRARGRCAPGTPSRNTRLWRSALAGFRLRRRRAG